MQMPPKSHQRSFDTFIEMIKNRLETYPVNYIEMNGYKPSAVSMLFVNKNGEPYVFLTQRSHHVTHHKGQVSFPGGRYDESDKNILATAAREVYEETGITPEAVEYLGRFDDYITTTKYHVACFVGRIVQDIEYQLDELEVADCFEVPFKIFANREYASVEMGDLAGTPNPIYHYYYDNYHIWGLTARILTEFSAKIFDEN